ncbi:acid-sensing ion channel 4-B-like [Clytia hemisphaerica]|uniref:acid-sensing ion channel 4-B-like n=1 Tax=Clytia hemisphaerica TaxID=252671 RepID=UPI0034D5CF84
MFSTVKKWMFKTSAKICIEEELKKIEEGKNENELEKKVTKLKSELELVQKMYKEQQQSNVVGLDSLTIHGLPRVISSPSGFVKICWFILFSASLALLYYFFCQTYDKFQSNPTYTVSSIEYGNLSFPAITICNMRNPRDHSVKYYQGSANANQLLAFALMNSTTLSEPDFERFSPGAGVFVDQIKKYCSFGGKSETCGKQYWNSVTLGPSCMMFNFDGKLTQKDIGLNNGLQLLLYIKSDTYLKDLNNSFYDYVNHYPTQGEILVAVHEPLTFPDFWSNVYHLQLGFLNHIQLYRKRTTKSQNCMRGYNESNLPIPGGYDQSVCLSVCNLRKSYKTCGDILPKYRDVIGYDALPALNISSNCSQCLEQFDGSSFWKNDCGCRQACSSTSYTSSTLVSSWLSNEKVMRINALLKETRNIKLSNKDIRHNFTILNVYYNTFRSSLEEEKNRFEIEDLIADVGGLMGLCIGASFFSIFELVFVFIIFLVDLPRRIWRRCCG